jgi:hypothetical protein
MTAARCIAAGGPERYVNGTDIVISSQSGHRLPTLDADLTPLKGTAVRAVPRPAPPLIVREIVARLLSAGQTARLMDLMGSGDTRRIGRAIGYLRNF